MAASAKSSETLALEIDTLSRMCFSGLSATTSGASLETVIDAPAGRTALTRTTVQWFGVGAAPDDSEAAWPAKDTIPTPPSGPAPFSQSVPSAGTESSDKVLSRTA